MRRSYRELLATKIRTPEITNHRIFGQCFEWIGHLRIKYGPEIMWKRKVGD